MDRMNNTTIGDEDLLATEASPECIDYVTTLDAATIELAERELGETPETRERALREMAAWLTANPHLNARRDARSVLHFLRGSKFRIDKAKQKMSMFYRMRAARTEWFSQRDPFAPSVAALLDIGVFLPLRQKDEQQRQVLIIRTAAHDPRQHHQNDVFKVGKMILDLLLAADETVSVRGLVVIFDMAGVHIGHAMALPPNMFKKTIESWECYACLNKKLEFVNAPFYVNAFLRTVLFFMSEKLKVRVTISRSTPIAVAPMSILPPEIGGNGETYAQLAAYWKDHVQQRAEWFVDDDRYKSVDVVTTPGRENFE